MTIKKAIGSIQLLIRTPHIQQDPEAVKALLLALQALRRIKNARFFDAMASTNLLPGETT